MVTPAKTSADRAGDTVVMRFQGDITSASESLVPGTYNALEGDVRKVMLDFSHVPYLNSSGIALLIQLLMAAGKASRKVVCFGLSPHFVKVFTMLGLSRYTTLHTDEATARAAAA